MKKIFFLLSLLPLFVSCDKDDDTTVAKNSHRIKQINYSATQKEVYTYDSENLVDVTGYQLDENEEWAVYFKNEYSYSGDNVTCIYSSINNGTWVIYNKSEYVIQDGLMTEEAAYEYNEEAWVPQWKWNYQYSGNNITAWQSYDYNSDADAFIQTGKSEYVYNDGILTESIEYSSGEEDDLILDYKNSFTYDGSTLSNITRYNWNVTDDIWDNDYKYELIYSGENVSKYNYYYWANESWMPSISRLYTYNSEGYLSAISVGENTVTYEYEEGNGNAKLFCYYPEELVNGEPTLKSAGVDLTDKYIPYYQRIRNW